RSKRCTTSDRCRGGGGATPGWRPPTPNRSGPDHPLGGERGDLIVVVAAVTENRRRVLSDPRRRAVVLRPFAVEGERERRQPEAGDLRVGEALQHPECLGLRSVRDI